MTEDILLKLYDRLDNELATLRGEVLYLSKCNTDLLKQIAERDDQIKNPFQVHYVIATRH